MSLLVSVLRDQRVVLGGLTAAAVGTVILICNLLEIYKEESEIKPVQPKTQYITQDTEDTLKPTTLDNLLGHYNFSIRDTAGKIVCDRAANDKDLIHILFWGITQPDYDERIKNLRALAVITDYRTLPLLHSWRFYSALVRSLELCLEPRSKQEKLNNNHFDDYFLRDMPEKLCLMFVSQLLERYEAESLVKADFVERWLAKQYWGDSPDEIINNFQQYMCHRANRITEIIGNIVQVESGRSALYKAGLISHSSKMIMDHGVAEREGGLDGVEGSDEDGADRHVGGRLQEQSVEEQRLRHRNREAMVFNDGTRPLNSDDIIQRGEGSW